MRWRSTASCGRTSRSAHGEGSCAGVTEGPPACDTRDATGVFVTGVTHRRTPAHRRGALTPGHPSTYRRRLSGPTPEHVPVPPFRADARARTGAAFRADARALPAPPSGPTPERCRRPLPGDARARAGAPFRAGTGTPSGLLPERRPAAPAHVLVRMSGQNIDRASWAGLEPGRALGPRRADETSEGSVMASLHRRRALPGRRGVHGVAPSQIASGAGGRLALAGARCERRLPARRGPAPEVPSRTPAPWTHVSTRGPERPTQCRARPAPRPWWDGPVAAAAARPPAAPPHELYERHVSTRRRHLRRSSRS